MWMIASSIVVVVIVQESGMMLCDQHMAVEMVLTLGQAFEVAYQLAVLKNGALEPRDQSSRGNKIGSKAQTAERPWRPPVNAVKPLRAAVVANTSNVTVGLR